ncbi:alpha-ketoglutarate-dependent dioxygenase FTO-like [Lytechinus pictus]|uniref:alpha-ketoglutarate-dependent dioxygenase FTO-like n=1 Tax=Lytechinus pictus TaxID=7653 RepID=UPI0030B9E079
MPRQDFLIYLKRSFSKIARFPRNKHNRRKIRKMDNWSSGKQKFLPYLMPPDAGFEPLREEKYPDFVHQPSSEISEDLAHDVAWAFNKLESEGFFYRHWVVVQGKHVLTPVSRTLVGNPGMTYRYLGLRIFALPWTFEDRKELSEVEKACSIIGRLNQYLKATSCAILKERQVDVPIQNTKMAKRTDEGTGSTLESKDTNVEDIEERSTERLRDHSENNVRTGEDSEQGNGPRGEVQGSGDSINAPGDSSMISSGSGSGDAPKEDIYRNKRKRQETRAKTMDEGTDFNVALINYMDPLNPELSLKPEPYYDLGPLAVPWHMDGNLVRGSTVAVYSYICESAYGAEKSRNWMIGINKPWDEVTPALAAPLASGDAYFMLADLNDTHRHCVIAGDQPRFASTHRVVDSGHGTLAYIQARCQSALENIIYESVEGGEQGSDGKPALRSLDSAALQLAEEVHNEVEFEWLRQFWMQGSHHATERSFWIKPMEDLEHSWECMEHMTKLAIEASMNVESCQEAARIIRDILPFIENRERQRCICLNRYSGDALLSIKPDRLPLYRPTWDDSDLSRPLPFTLTKVI